jgi:tellurite resistance protein TehA-like permease
MGWWGFTFPTGVYTSAIRTLHCLTGFSPFAVIGPVLALALCGFWLLVVSRTLNGMWHGNLFHAPRLRHASHT